MRVLLTEDDEILADGITKALRQAGFAVDHVAGGLDADQALQSNNFDLLILDLGFARHRWSLKFCVGCVRASKFCRY